MIPSNLNQEFATCLAPHAPGLEVARVLVHADQILLWLVSTAPTAVCPGCHIASAAIHSRYRRTLADSPWAATSVQLYLLVRKFRCRIATCSRRVFTERLPTVAAPYARHTIRRQAILRAIGFALGGQAGARLADELHLPVSRDSLLRLIRATPLPPPKAPRVVGLDDWAFRRGHRYGTILVDLERQCVLDLLPDRQTATVAAWLRQYPSIAIVSRDRAEGYAAAARLGAPQARQVADRWHILKNLTATLEQFFLTKPAALKQTAALLAVVPSARPTEDGPPPAAPAPPSVPPPTALTVARRVRQERRVAAYRTVHALRAQQLEVATIARQVGISRPTVYRYLRMPQPPAPKHPPARAATLLSAYKPYLLARWSVGCRNARQLWREIKAQGYPYSARTVERYVGQLRAATGQARSFRQGPPLAVEEVRSKVAPHGAYSAGQMAGLWTLRAEERTPEQAAVIQQVCTADAEVAQTYEQVTAFTEMVRRRTGQGLAAWIAAVLEQGAEALQRFAEGVQADFAAVEGGLTLPWSQGQVEGQVNRLKMVKRTMFGRAKFDLLRQRVLHGSGRPPISAGPHPVIPSEGAAICTKSA